MDRPIYHFFTADHKRIERLLEKAIENPDEINPDYYHQFRIGLLTHIKMEEKTLFPAAAIGNGGRPLPLAAKLRLDHGALTALMTVPPTLETIKATKQILDIHDRLEEEEGGMYEMCEKLTDEQTDEIMDKLSKVTKVPVHPFNKHPMVFSAMKRALERAGFDYDELIKN